MWIAGVQDASLPWHTWRCECSAEASIAFPISFSTHYFHITKHLGFLPLVLDVLPPAAEEAEITM